MVSINYSAREVCCKIVYYGPGLSGKTTNLQYIHEKVPQDTRGKLISLATEADRTLYFDFLPINIGSINDFQAKFQLYTVPGQVYYNATRKLVLRGVDGVVFVADSQRDKMDENIESLANLEENLREYGYDPDELPLVVQYNKRDLPNVMSLEELDAQLNTKGRPTFEASATLGNGVFDTLKLIIKLVFEKAKSGGTTPQPTARTAAQPAQPAPPKEAAYPEPAAQQPTPATTASEAQPQPAPQPAAAAVAPAKPIHRPYPGSDTARVQERTAVPVGLGAQPTPDADRAAQAAPAETAAESAAQPQPAPPAQAQELAPEPASDSSPQMAPSLRKRGDGKKRGFLKRLFGIK